MSEEKSFLIFDNALLNHYKQKHINKKDDINRFLQLIYKILKSNLKD